LPSIGYRARSTLARPRPPRGPPAAVATVLMPTCARNRPTVERFSSWPPVGRVVGRARARSTHRTPQPPARPLRRPPCVSGRRYAVSIRPRALVQHYIRIARETELEADRSLDPPTRVRSH
jgi:hypothetical protein